MTWPAATSWLPCASRPPRSARRICSCSKTHPQQPGRGHHHPPRGNRAIGRTRPEPPGQPVAGQEVEVWSKGSTWLRTNPGLSTMAPSGRPPTVRSGRPKTCWSGQRTWCWFVRRGSSRSFPGWIRIGEQPPLLLPLLQRPLRTIRGRVVDCQASRWPTSRSFSRATDRSGPRRERRQTAGSCSGDFARGRCFSSRGARVFACSAG